MEAGSEVLLEALDALPSLKSNCVVNYFDPWSPAAAEEVTIDCP